MFLGFVQLFLMIKVEMLSTSMPIRPMYVGNVKKGQMDVTVQDEENHGLYLDAGWSWKWTNHQP